jgi:hypothetical protein
MRESFAKQGLREDRLKVRYLFHGTKNFNAVKEIAHAGFDQNFSRSDNSRHIYGRGCYFARDAHYSDSGYACSAPDGSQHKIMFLAAVWQGNYCVGRKDMCNPPPIQGSSVHAAYDMTVDNDQNPSIFVIYRDGQAYPMYEIRYMQ